MLRVRLMVEVSYLRSCDKAIGPAALYCVVSGKAQKPHKNADTGSRGPTGTQR